MEVAHLLNGADEGTWHILPSCKDKENPVRIKIRALKPYRRRELLEESQKVNLEGKIPIKELDFKKYYDLQRSECILDWENILKNGKPLPCTEENKKLLDDNWNEFNTFWNRLTVDSAELQALLLENDQKN